MELMERRRILLNTPHINIVTGLQFVTDMVAPLDSLVINFSPIQDLHGYDHPWPPGGGANIWDEEWEVGSISSSTGENVISSSQIRSKNYISVKPSTGYYVVNGSGSTIGLRFYTSDKTYKGYITVGNTGSNITTDSDVYYLRFIVLNTTEYLNNIAINYPATVTTYSPYSNVCPISGRTGLEVTITGKNLFGYDESKVLDGETSTGTIRSYYPTGITNSTITFSAHLIDSSNVTSAFINIGKLVNGKLNVIGTFLSTSGDITNRTVTFAEGEEAVLMSAVTEMSGIKLNLPKYNIQLEFGSTPTAYEPYHGTTYSISWQTEAGTVYGGTIDVTSGVLTVTHMLYTFDGSSDEVWTHYTVAQGELFRTSIPERKPGELTGISGTICDSYKVTGQSDRADGTVSGSTFTIDFINNEYSTATAWRANLAEHPVNIVCELNTPITHQLTPQQVLALKGINNLSMSGQVKFWTHRDIQ